MKKRYGIVSISLIFIAIAFFGVFFLKLISNTCEQYGGKWIGWYGECVDESSGDIKGFCEKFNGEYDECASACRHSPLSSCVAVCVQVCSL